MVNTMFHMDNKVTFKTVYLVFPTVYSSWNSLLSKRPSAAGAESQSRFVQIKNGLQKWLIVIALAITTIFVGLYDLITFPYRYYKMHSAIRQGLYFDLQRLGSQEKDAIRAEILQYMEKKCPPERIPPQDRKEFAEKILAYYARSHTIYGPVVRAWTDYLLEKAHRENRKLVFMARDGIAPYKMALELMKKDAYRAKYPNLAKEGNINLIFLSRRMVRNSPELLKEYAEKNLGITAGDSYLFVDVGFEGSMIQTIREKLEGTDVQFEYLISLTNQATGFLASKDHPLTSVNSASGNFGVHWLEDSHQGSLRSPHKLIKDENGTIHTDSHYPNKERCVSRYSFEHLLRKFSLRAVVRWSEKDPLTSDQLQKTKRAFNETLELLKNRNLPLLIQYT